ncbi:MAG: hypothetical protein WBP64_20900 [Nitrososphaeraceae archaeon]|jgi:hypothetical protein
MAKLEDSGQIIYLQYKNLEDMLKVILFSAQSALGLTPMLYSIKYTSNSILFIQTGIANGAVVHYLVMRDARPEHKYIELKRLTGEFRFVDSIGTDTMSLYIPVLELETSTLKFPI